MFNLLENPWSQDTFWKNSKQLWLCPIGGQKVWGAGAGLGIERRHDRLHLLFTALRAIRKLPLIASSKLSFSSFIPIISPWLFRVSCVSHPHEGEKKKIKIKQGGEWQRICLQGGGSGIRISGLTHGIPSRNSQSHKNTWMFCISPRERDVEFTQDKSVKFLVLTGTNPFSRGSKQ